MKKIKWNLCRISFAAAIVFALGGGCERQAQMSSEELQQQTLDALSGKTADWKKALKFAGKAVKKNPADANAHVIYALALEQCGGKSGALDEIKKASELDPKNFTAIYTKGRMLLEGEHYEDAIGPLRDARKMRPEDPNVLLLNGKCAMHMGLYDESMSCYQGLARNAQFSGRPEIYNELAVIMLKKKDIRKASKLFELALRKAPENHTVVLNMAVLLDRHLRNPQEALKFYQKYLELTLSNPELKNKRAAIDARMQELRTGI